MGIEFPESRSDVRGHWRPIQIEPVIGSGERITIGVIANTDSDYYVMEAPGLARLRCLYDENYTAVFDAAKLALEAIEKDLSQRGLRVIDNVETLLEGIEVGLAQECAGSDLPDIAYTGIRASSSLAVPEKSKLVEQVKVVDETVTAKGNTPDLYKRVREIVVERRPGLENAFGKFVRLKPTARPTAIGFVGSKLVANFGVINVNNPGRSLPTIKGRLWDLEAYRDIRSGEFLEPPGQMVMLVQVPRPHSAEYSDEQYEKSVEAFEEVSAQAVPQDLIVSRVGNLADMATYIVENEARAALI